MTDPEETAKRLLPCHPMCGFTFEGKELHVGPCPQAFRPAVAATLRELKLEREELKRTYDKTVERLERELADLKGVAWVCEQHPDKEFPHDECAGPGMPPNPWNRILVERDAEISRLKAEVERLALIEAQVKAQQQAVTWLLPKKDGEI